MSSEANGAPLDPDDQSVLDRFRQFRETGDDALRVALIEEHRWIPQRCARRFANKGEPLDDLEQVGAIGLVKAAGRFDPELGIPFPAYAIPTVMGELRRHFRDATWALRVPRRAKDLHVRMGPAVEALRHDLGRAPTPSELAEYLSVPEEHVLEATEAGAAYSTSSLDQPTVGGALTAGERVGVDDALLGLKEDRAELAALLESLPERERTIIYLRFFEERSQAEIAERIGTSQVHVSRLLKVALAKLRAASE